MASYSVEVRQGVGDVVTIAVHGEVDLAVGGALTEAIVAVGPPAGSTVVVDLDGVTFLDSSGISALVRAHHRLAEDGAGVALVGGPDHVRKVLSITGADRIFAEIDGLV